MGAGESPGARGHSLRPLQVAALDLTRADHRGGATGRLADQLLWRPTTLAAPTLTSAGIDPARADLDGETLIGADLVEAEPHDSSLNAGWLPTTPPPESSP
jgi:hypothetical protein